MIFLLVLLDEKVVGEIDEVSVITDSSGQFLKIRTSDDIVLNELLNTHNHLLFILSKGFAMSLNSICQYEFIESKDFFGNKLSGKTVKLKFLSFNEYIVTIGSEFDTIYKSWFRNKKIESLINGTH